MKRPPPAEGATGTTPVVDVSRLLSPRGEAVLVHAGQSYRLRITSRGKLILTK